jgi:hypothetical protein
MVVLVVQPHLPGPSASQHALPNKPWLQQAAQPLAQLE